MFTDMDQPLLNHLLALAARTGDRLIILDPATQQPFVVMPVAQYEALVLRNAGDQRIAMTRGGDAMPMPSAPASVPFTAVVPQVEGLDLGALARESERIEAATGATAFTPEPTTAALPDDERFYVEPLE